MKLSFVSSGTINIASSLVYKVREMDEVSQGIEQKLSLIEWRGVCSENSFDLRIPTPRQPTIEAGQTDLLKTEKEDEQLTVSKKSIGNNIAKR